MNHELDLGALRSQDHTAFAALVKQQHHQLIMVASAIIGNAQAEEVVQDAWIAIYAALPQFEGRSKLSTWLYTIVSNTARSRLRREKRMVAPVQSPAGEAANAETAQWESRFDQRGHWAQPPQDWDLTTPEQLLEEAQLQQCIDHTLGLLSEQQRAAFVLRDIEQQSLAEICNILQVSGSNIRVLVHRARLKLMQVIEHYQETGTC